MKKIKDFCIKYLLPVWTKVSVWYLTRQGYKVEEPKKK